MKLAIVINGAGGVGKDTLCAIAATKYKVRNVSSITPIKELAARCGWKGEKTDRARKFLSDLKRLSIEYSDFPTQYLTEQYMEFLSGDEEILFAHIREPEEIAKFVSATEGRAVTLLVRAGRRFVHGNKYGNTSDDCVEEYPYNYIFYNDRPLGKETEQHFLAYLERMVANAR
jgi:cytidylate kinase